MENKGGVGSIIKVIAIILLVLGLIGSVLMISEIGILGTIIAAVGTAFVALLLYGFGEMIENIADMNLYICSIMLWAQSMKKKNEQMESTETAIKNISTNTDVEKEPVVNDTSTENFDLFLNGK